MGSVTDPLAYDKRSRPATPEGARAFTIRPFQRVARAHVANGMADAMLAAALADSIFFSLPADNARSPVVRYLIITMLPFAVIAPLVGPLIDRLKGGHRFVLVGTLVLRAGLAWLLIDQISDTTPGPAFFLLALCVLVCQRAYNVARSALVPSVVGSDDELIEANSKLAIIGGLSAFVGILPAAVLLKLFGPGWALGLAVVTYSVGAVYGMRIPRSRLAVAKADTLERSELRGVGIVLAGSAMGLLRGCVGFLTMLIAFDFRGGDRAAWQFAVVAGVSVFAGLVGAAVAPRLKARATEETILTASLGLVVLGAFGALFISELVGACVVGAAVGFAASLGKLAFDSILQRDAPDANRGRAFARFETRFQLTYVIGSFIPVAFHVGARFGFAVLLAISVFATVSYVIGRLAWAHRTGERQTAATAAAVEIEERFAEVSGEVKERLAAAPRQVFSMFRSDGDGDDPADDSADDDRTEIVARPDPAAATVDLDQTPVPTEPAPDLFDQDLAGSSPTAWEPGQAELPWSSVPADDTTRELPRDQS